MRIIKNVIYLLLLSTILVSCVPNMYFDDPQPSNDKNEFMFKHKFQGVYESLNDSSTLVISEFRIIQKSDYILKFSKEEIDSIEDFEFKNETLSYRDIGVKITIRVNGDSASVRIQSKKSIFHISTSNILRYYKNTYFLNYRTSENLWKVKILDLNRKGELTFKSLQTSLQSISSLKDITPIDSLSKDDYYKVNPSKREIRKLLRSGLFTEDSKFIKVE